MSIRTGCLVLFCMASFSPALRAADADPLLPNLTQQIANKQPTFLVAAEVNRPSREYREGDALSLRVASEQDAYLYVYYQQADGKTFQIFPNRHRPDNQVKARQAVVIPDGDELWTWQVGKPFGKETIKVVASKQKLDNSFQPRFENSGRFIRLSTDDIKGVALEIGEEATTDWAETDLQITTYPDDQPPEVATAKRVGVFIGVSKHQFSQQVVADQVGRHLAAKEIAANNVTAPEEQQKILDKWKQEYTFEELSSDLVACHRDAQKLAKAMAEYGRLSEFRLLTNEDATRANIEKVLTQWLPSVTRPGDTVVLHLSLHTGQIEDTSGEEPDQLDEFFVPHDGLCLTKEHADKLTDFFNDLSAEEQKDFKFVKVLLDTAAPYYQKDQGMRLMLEETTVVDDLLARWLQHISGRQLLLIADTCHSAGYGDSKTGIIDRRDYPQALKSLRTSYLDNEFDRMRAMGQKEQALLASCQLEQSAQERAEGDFGVMTGAIVDLLGRQKGAVTLEQGFQYIEGEMKKYFEANTSIPASQPYLKNNCTRPVLLKL